MQIVSGELYRLLTNAAIFTGKDDTLPMLMHVQLYGDGKRLVAAATDRFQLGVASCEYEGEPFDPVMIHRDDIALIGRTLKRRGSWQGNPVSMRVTPKGKRFYVHTLNTSLLVYTGNYEFPQWKQLLPTGKEESQFGEVPVFGLDPVRLAKFGKVDAGYDQASWTMWSPSRPLCVRMGDDFVGLLMPIRFTDSAKFGTPEWAK